jgi:hypothetical protein
MSVEVPSCGQLCVSPGVAMRLGPLLVHGTLFWLARRRIFKFLGLEAAAAAGGAKDVVDALLRSSLR